MKTVILIEFEHDERSLSTFRHVAEKLANDLPTAGARNVMWSVTSAPTEATEAVEHEAPPAAKKKGRPKAAV